MVDGGRQRSSTAGEIPQHRLDTEVHHLLQLPDLQSASSVLISIGQPVPLESLQHPLSFYQAPGGMSMNLQRLRIESLCQQFKLDTFATDWPALAQQVAEKETSYADFLEQLLLREH